MVFNIEKTNWEQKIFNAKLVIKPELPTHVGQKSIDTDKILEIINLNAEKPNGKELNRR